MVLEGEDPKTSAYANYTAARFHRRISSKTKMSSILLLYNNILVMVTKARKHIEALNSLSQRSQNYTTTSVFNATAHKRYLQQV